MNIKYLNGEDEQWDGYAVSHPSSTIFHKTGWRNVVEKTFGHTPYYLYAEEDGKICGLLPLFLIKNILFGTFMVSIPYTIYGGALSDNEEAARLLIEQAKRIADEHSARYIEFRNRERCMKDFPYNNIYVSFSMELPVSMEDCIKRLPSKKRTKARKGIKYGLESFFSRDIEPFYRLFAVSMRRLCSPVYPRSLFKHIMDEFPEETIIFYVRLKEEVVLGTLIFLYKDTMLPKYLGTDHAFSRYNVNSYQILKLIEYGCENGFRYLDMSRSRKGTGAYNSKIAHGFKPSDLYYEYYLNTAKDIPNISPSNPRFDLPKKIWQRLPLSVTNWLGPRITRGIC